MTTQDTIVGAARSGLVTTSMTDFCSSRSDLRYLFFGGKGGVGKTVLAGMTAVHLAGAGKRVLLASTNPVQSLSGLLDQDVVTDQFFGMIMVFVALLSTGYALQAVLKTRSEESGGRVEPVLATALSRWRWAGSHVLVAAVGGVVMLTLGGAGVGLSAAIALSDAGEFPRLTGAALVHAPTVWLLVGLAVALYGVASRASLVVWAVLAYAAFILVYGGVLDLPAWFDDLTPFGHVPRLPAQDLRILPLTVLTGLAAGLTWAGLAAFRKRDLELS